MILDSHSHSISDLAVVNLPMGEMPQEGFLYSAGIHPWDAGKVDESSFKWLEKVVSLPQVVAIGECGLDSLCDVDMAPQISLFEKMIDLSQKSSLPMIIHCVRAWNYLFSIYKSFSPSSLWVIHGFRGKPELAQRLLRCGFYLSYGSRFNTDSLLLTPASRLLVESDEFSLEDSFNEIARALSISVDELKGIVRENNLCVFG